MIKYTIFWVSSYYSGLTSQNGELIVSAFGVFSLHFLIALGCSYRALDLMRKAAMYVCEHICCVYVFGRIV